MKKILFAIWPALGHVRPALELAKRLKQENHEVIFYTSKAYSNKIEKVMDSKKEIKNVDNLNNTSEKNKTIESEKTTKDKVQRKDSDSGGKLSDDSSEKQKVKTNEKED